MMDYDNSEGPDDYNDDFIDNGLTEEENSSEEEKDEEVFSAQVKRMAKKTKCKMNNVNQGCKYKRMSHSESKKDEYSPEPACSGTKEEIRGYKRALQSDSEELKPDVKHVKLTMENHWPDNREEKRSRSAKEGKETSVLCFDREDKTCAKKRQDKSDKRCERVKPTKNTQNPNRDSPPCKRKLSDSETNDYEGEEKWGGGIKGVNPSKIKCTRSPGSDTDSKQEERRTRKKTHNGRSDNTPRQILEKTEPERSFEQQEALEKQELSNHHGTTSSHQTPGVSQSQVQRFSGEAAKVAKLTVQAAWPTDTLQQQSSDHGGKGDREEEWPDREDHPDHAVKPTSAAESSEEEDSDVESDFNDRLDNRPESTGCSKPETNFGENEYLVSMCNLLSCLHMW